jgi:3-oxoacyl-[acyl-carrier-protein] synthase-3
MLYLHSIGHFHPENVIDNQFLESLEIGTSDQWITERTGIRSRRTVLPLSYIVETRNRDSHAADGASLYTNAETGCRAANMALLRAGLRSSDVGLVIAGGSSPRTSAPAEACIIANALGIEAPAMDINSACSTFAVQLHLLSHMDPAALPDFVLVVNPENLTRTVNYAERTNAVLIGDCTSATIVSPRIPGRALVRHTMHKSDPQGWNKVVIPAAGHLAQDGSAVQNFAIRKTVSIIEELRQYCSGAPYFIGHQANLQMVRSASSRAGIAQEKHLYNVDRYGNCGAAGAPSVLSQSWESFKTGDEILVGVVGAGLTWAGLLMEFC